LALAVGVEIFAVAVKGEAVDFNRDCLFREADIDVIPGYGIVRPPAGDLRGPQ
jgi:hypothetical protein